MKIKLNTVGFTEGAKLKVSDNLINVGIGILALGLITTFTGKLLSNKSSTWMICKDNQEAVDLISIMAEQLGLK